MARTRRTRICVVGAGPMFLSGISYYTHQLSAALSVDNEVSAVLMRRLIPRRLYPGRDHVGRGLNEFKYPVSVATYDGVDWYWVPSLIQSIRFLRRQSPDVVVFQWWTGAVAHSYLAIAREARRAGAKIVIEFHEVQDTGELRVPLVARYVDTTLPRLLAKADGVVVHSEFDRQQIEARFGSWSDRPVAVAAHGPYNHLKPLTTTSHEGRERGVCSLLYFGVIRPFKGVDDLLTAFDSLTDDEAKGFSLTIVGETWEGFTLPAELAQRSRHRDRIKFVNRYVSDGEAASYFAAADAVILPYHRSSSSGPLHLAMSYGLPVVVSAVGGLVEAAREYEGATFVPPHDPASIRAAILQIPSVAGRTYVDPHSWATTAGAYRDLIDRLCEPDWTEHERR